MQGEFTLKHTAFVNKSNSLVQGSRIIIYPLLSTYGDEIDGYAERFYDDGTVKVDEYEEYIFAVCKGVSVVKDQDFEYAIDEVFIILSKNYLITIHSKGSSH